MGLGRGVFGRGSTRQAGHLLAPFSSESLEDSAVSPRKSASTTASGAVACLTMLKTPLCDQLGIDYPIFSVGFGRGAGPELVAAVSNAGGCGVLGATGQPAPYIREQIQRVRKLTDKPFGANVILVNELRPETIGACIEERVRLLVLFWGDPSPYVEHAHRRGVKVFVQVGSVDEARAAAAAGVDAIIAQGMEAGGHVKSTTALSILLPAVVDAVRPVPVLASGGIADGRGLAAALALGAQGVSMGTRFVASAEAFVHSEYKQRVVQSTAEDTVYSADLFDIWWPDAPHRALRNRLVEEWEAAGRPPSGQRPGEGIAIGTITGYDGATIEIPRYASFMTTPAFKGDVEYAPLWAGESVGLVNDVRPAGEIVRDIVREAEEVLAGLVRGRPSGGRGGI